ncbi:DUF1559 domain-containing protein [Paludisphaera borealis]|uniref:DUF1559 domain-containing protein n=1 Tax=Paludisphaera borealis TaxID=1387353 RepID=A0A1U7CQW2_9BACT|nr:DUF1559 domain-containing protein [Paludisphaera borealis]APW61321.1 hypothetical protein BSF38_02835 [Paludisphaera borealis]
MAISSAPVRRGFTLLEVVVVVSILSLLTVLSLRAVQAAREAARSVQCTNNLKQIALSIQNYVAQCGYFPPVNVQTSSLGFKEGAAPSVHSFSALSRVMPWLDLGPAHNSANFMLFPDFPDGLSANQTVMTTHVSAFICPSDGARPVAGYGRCNYRFNIGVTQRIAPVPWDAASLGGAFTTHFDYRPSDIQDGLTNTSGVSELLQGDWVAGITRSKGDYALLDVETALRRDMTCDVAASLCSARGAGAVSFESRGGESWFLTGFHFSNYNHCATPNWVGGMCAFDLAIEPIHSRAIHDGVFGPSSRHGGIVHTSMLDGSVRSVRDGISLQVWRALGTRSGGEILDAGAASEP